MQVSCALSASSEDCISQFINVSYLRIVTYLIFLFNEISDLQVERRYYSEWHPSYSESARQQRVWKNFWKGVGRNIKI